MFGRKKKQEKIKRELSSAREPVSRATRIRMLLKKNNAIFGSKQAITDFKEPVLMLIRRSRAIEFYEDASKGSFVFKHSDGHDREIYLEPSNQMSFDYGKRKFKGYICHEDFPLPIPENPIVTVDTINGIVEKSTMDMRKINNRGKELQIKTIKMVGGLIILGFIVFILWKTHAFEKVIGMLTGQPYIDPSTIVNNIGGGGGASSIQNSSLQIASTG